MSQVIDVEFFDQVGGFMLSDLKVLESAQGYYIGRTDENGLPLTRESAEYYRNKYIAQTELDEETFLPRICAENELLYQMGLPRPVRRLHAG